MRSKQYGMKISDKLYASLFITWFICMPFGSSSASVSLGFMTIYPAFILMLGLFLIGIAKIRLDWSKQEWYLIGFLSLPMIYMLLYCPFVQNMKHAIIDLRSWILFWMTIMNCMMGNKIMESEKVQVALHSMSSRYHNEDVRMFSVELEIFNKSHDEMMWGYVQEE